MTGYWWMILLLVVVLCSFANCSSEELTLGNGPWYKTFENGKVYNYTVDCGSQFSYSSYMLQVHAEKHSLTLTNASTNCTPTRECSTTGTHVGLVQNLATSASYEAPYSVGYTCSGEDRDCSTQLVLVAIVGIYSGDPVPGGCSLTSALEMDSGLHGEKGRGFFTISFQNSIIGFDSQVSPQPPCTDQFQFVTRLEYSVYQKCLGSPTVNSTFQAIVDMLTPINLDNSIKVFQYNDAKRISLYLLRNQGVVLNVVARDTKTETMSAYIPTASLGCEDFSDGHCSSSLSVATWVCGILVGLVGLFLCFLAHRFFYIEVILFTFLISVFIMYTILLALTDWSGVDLLVGTAGFGFSITFLLFVLLFLTNWYGLFLVFFGIAMGFILAATLLFTPLGSYDVLKLPYTYVLILLTGMVVWLPFMFLSMAMLNIVASAIVGSYAVTFSIGLFLQSSVSDVVLRVVNTAAIRGYISVHGYCEMTTIDFILFGLWVLLCALGVTMQVAIELFRKMSFERKRALSRQYTNTNSDFDEPVKRQYSAFPSASLFKRMKRFIAPRMASRDMQQQFIPGVDTTRARDNTRLLSPGRPSSTERYYQDSSSYASYGSTSLSAKELGDD